MRVRDSQTFFSLYHEPHTVEVATGEADLAASLETWQRETKQLGQVATPGVIGKLMAKWVMSGKPCTVLDPAAGLGGLLAACRQFDLGVELVGAERDVETLCRAKTSAPSGTKLILVDYLKSDAGQFDGIIANPPYVKAQRLRYSEGDWRYFEERFGTPLDRLTNLYALFLLKIWEDLAPRGRAAVILPAEFLNANFGEEIKKRLLYAIRPAAIVVFEPSLNLFADALTTSAIVLLEKRHSKAKPIWAKLADSVETAEAVVDALLAGEISNADSGALDLAMFSPQAKWLNLLLNGVPEPAPVPFAKRVGDYFKCRRGIATGANDYFCLSPTSMREHQLSHAHVEPCVTKATDADGLIFTREKFEVLVGRNRRCFLLNPSSNGEGLSRYLQVGVEQGVSKRHLPSHRPVWYRPENRAVADIWVAVFSRESVKFILNTSGAKNLTCFHGLYAKPGNEALAPLLTLFLNSSLGRTAFSQVNRFYGDGLNKLEPKDVEDMPCPEMPTLSLKDQQEIAASLAKLDGLPLEERTAQINELVKRYFGLTQEINHATEEPPSSQPSQVRSRRLAEQHTHRAVPTP